MSLLRLYGPCLAVVSLVLLPVSACGASPDGDTGDTAASETAAAGDTDRPLTIQALPDPCEWLSADEAQEILGLAEAPQQTPMGGPDAAGRACVFTNAAQTAWINAGYQGLNPQVMSAQGRSESELVELASTVYTHGLEHVESRKTAGYPTLAFSDADRTIMVVFTNIGKARNLPEGISDRLSISSFYNVVLNLTVPEQTPEARLEALSGLVDRPVAQLQAAAD